MDESFGPATFFVTLSRYCSIFFGDNINFSAEYRWDDMLQFLRSVNSDWNVEDWTLSAMCSADPVSVAGHFVHRFKAAMTHLILPDNGIFGKVSQSVLIQNYFSQRLEFQLLLSFRRAGTRHSPRPHESSL
jgi:hypothetical protein